MQGYGIDGFPGARSVENRLWALAASLLPERDTGTYIQAQMDLGATVAAARNPPAGDARWRRYASPAATAALAKLPSARPRKAVRKRSARFAVILTGDAVLLERRPPSGIWGGLLALPEIPEDDDPTSWAAQRYGLAIVGHRPLAPLRHAFTHFTLEIEPQLMHAIAAAPGCADDGPVWQALDRLADAALPRRCAAS